MQAIPEGGENQAFRSVSSGGGELSRYAQENALCLGPSDSEDQSRLAPEDDSIAWECLP